MSESGQLRVIAYDTAGNRSARPINSRSTESSPQQEHVHHLPAHMSAFPTWPAAMPLGRRDLHTPRLQPSSLTKTNQGGQQCRLST